MRRLFLSFGFLSLISCGNQAAVPTLHRPPDQWAEPNFQIPELDLTEPEKKNFALRSEEFEYDSKPDGITMWNEGESFPSLGIGHYIWFPEYSDPSKKPIFVESFPRLIKFMVQFRRLALSDIPVFLQVDENGNLGTAAPWKTRQEFYAEFNGPRLTALREFLHRPEIKMMQVDFQIFRLRESLEKILSMSPDAEETKEFVKAMAQSWKGIFALVDYVNFKGEGLNLDESVRDPISGRVYGWGLYQVFEECLLVWSRPDLALAIFKNAGSYVLERRVRYRAEDKRYLAGWKNRIAKY